MNEQKQNLIFYSIMCLCLLALTTFIIWHHLHTEEVEKQLLAESKRRNDMKEEEIAMLYRMEEAAKQRAGKVIDISETKDHVNG